MEQAKLLQSAKGNFVAYLLVAVAVCRVHGAEDRFPRRVHPSLPVIAAESAILTDAESGTILWEKNADQRRPPASLTKVMTAILILEEAKLDDWVTVSPTVLQAWGSCIGLKPGERITIHDLLCAILLKSANDACLAAAEHLEGSVASFVEHMNQKAHELGATHTHFVNPHGLHDDTHLSTARDLALIARYALNNSVFRQMVRTKNITIHWQGLQGRNSLRLINKNKLLWRYSESDGVKTGYTRQAGNCLIASATSEGWQLLSVVMKSPNIWNDSQRLLRFGFTDFCRVPIVSTHEPIAKVHVSGGAPSEVELIAQRSLAVVVPIERKQMVEHHTLLTPHRAPVRKGERLGWIIAENHGHELARVPLVASRSVGRAWVHHLISSITLGGGISFAIWLLCNAHRKAAKSSRRRRRRIPTWR